ncbi:MAG: FAD-binding oxidoreductase, partial [Sphingomonadaceae bacterium]
MLGASVAWFLTDTPGFDGRILVIERDPTYQSAATSLTNSCMRQQFSQEINVRISQFAADFVNNFRTYMGGDPRVPQPVLHSFGYMYMAATRAAAAGLRDLQKLQARAGAGTRFLTPGEIDEAYPFYNLTDITGANHNLTDEGYFDGGTLFDWWKRSARERGAEFIANEAAVLTLGPNGRRIDSVTLASGQTISCGTLVNAAGTRAPNVAAMAGIALPIEPRKRYTFIFSAEQPLDRDLPLTIDPSGVHMRSDGRYYLCGCPPD